MTLSPEMLFAYRLDEVDRIRKHNLHLKEIRRKLIVDEMPLWRKNTNELRPDTKKHKMQFTETCKRAFAKDIIKFIAP